MNSRNPDLFREATDHGNLRFHLMLHEYTTNPSCQERLYTHWHEEYELLAVEEGRGIAHVHNHRFPIARGDILFVDSGNLHSLSAEPGVPLSFYAVVFGRELICSSGNDDIQQKYILSQSSGRLVFRDHFRAGEEAWEALHPALEELRRLCLAGIPGRELLIKAALLQAWHFLCQYPATALAPGPGDRDAKTLVIKEILQFMQENYSRAITLPELAGRFHMSEGQFCRLFKSRVNMTATEYLNQYRVSVACDLLRESSAPVTAVAMDCGYGNISYFNRMFRRYMHCTPREYREADGSL